MATPRSVTLRSKKNQPMRCVLLPAARCGDHRGREGPVLVATMGTALVNSDVTSEHWPGLRTDCRVATQSPLPTGVELPFPHRTGARVK